MPDGKFIPLFPEEALWLSRLRVGDPVTRWLAGTITMPLVVTALKGDLITCGLWTFDRATGAEIDPDGPDAAAHPMIAAEFQWEDQPVFLLHADALAIEGTVAVAPTPAGEAAALLGDIEAGAVEDRRGVNAPSAAVMAVEAGGETWILDNRTVNLPPPTIYRWDLSPFAYLWDRRQIPGTDQFARIEAS